MKNKSKRGIMPLLFVGVLMGALDISIVGPAIPAIEKSMDFPGQYSSWIFSIYILFNLVGTSLFAKLSDKYGRRAIYILSIIIFASGSLIVALSGTFRILLMGRAIQGFGASGIFPVASAVIGDIYPEEKRGKMLGILGAVFGLAFLIGPFIAGVVLHYLTWNILFVINLPISIGLIIFSFRILPNKAVSDKVEIDWKGITFLGLFLAGFAFAINNLKISGSAGVDLQWILFAVFISVISLLLFIFAERRNPHPIIKLSYFGNTTIVVTGIIAIVSGMVEACFVFIPKYSVETFSVSTSTASFMLAPTVLAGAVGAPIFGRLIDKYGVKPILKIGIASDLIGFTILTVLGGEKFFFYTGGVFIGLGLSILLGSSLRYIMLNVAESEDRAVAQGMLTIFTSSGQMTGAAGFGLIIGGVAAQNPFTYVFLIQSAALLLVLLMSYKIRLKNNN